MASDQNSGVTHEPGCLGHHYGDCAVSGMFDQMRDEHGACTICGSKQCRYPASQSCFAAVLDQQEADPPA